MRQITLSLIAALLVCPALRAELELDVRSDVPSKVHLDGEYVGNAPLILRDIPAGSHRLEIENTTTGEIKQYATYSPRVASTAKVIFADFRPGGGPLPVVTRLAPAPVYRTAPPVSPRTWTTTRRPPPANGTPENVARAKRHTRNVLLGLTVASQVQGKKRDRVRSRNVGTGLIILNEVLRR